MSVYTTVSTEQLHDFLSHYSLGKLLSYTGIQAGIENTNYRVETSKGLFVLTLFESFNATELEAYVSLLNHLGNSNFLCPQPQRAKNQSFINKLNGKPAALFNFLSGRSLLETSVKQCRAQGEYVAKLHVYAADSGFSPDKSSTLSTCRTFFKEIKTYLNTTESELFNEEFEYQSMVDLTGLPQGVIHADLFKDNMLFVHDDVSGMLDFYSARQDYFVFDIAISCNDWCLDNNQFKQSKLDGFLSGYHQVRPLSDDEVNSVPIFLRRAAFRFWLSRLHHKFYPKEGELTLVKDPLVMQQLLMSHRANSMAA